MESHSMHFVSGFFWACFGGSSILLSISAVFFFIAEQYSPVAAVSLRIQMLMDSFPVQVSFFFFF